MIERGLTTFVEVGAALLRIREERLYRATHGSFEDYCRERWGWGRAHAYRLMDAAAVVQDLSPIGDTPLPRNEAQARELARLPDPESRRLVWHVLISAVSAIAVVSAPLAFACRGSDAAGRRRRYGGMGDDRP